MRLVTLFLIAAFAASTVGAASYQKNDGTIVDPILSWWHGSNPSTMEPHSYSGANLEPGADLSGADLRFAYLYNANLSNADLTDANLTSVHLHNANLSNADLTDADLTGAHLRYTDLTDAKLSNANLTSVHLPNANLSNADLTDANLTSVHLEHANLTGANLTGADLTDADLTGAHLRVADLSYANLSGSMLLYPRPYWLLADWTDAYYYTDNVPDWPAVMPQAWRDSEGILAIDPTSGDINSDGVFDAADYTVWQDNGGYPIDYRTWKDNFGQSTASSSGADHVPEPTTLLLALLALVAAPLRVRCG